jgi:hypothetical protein
MFASLQNQFSKYWKSSLRFDIEKKHHYRSFRSLRFIIHAIKGTWQWGGIFWGFCDSKLLPWPIFCQIGPLKARFSCLKFCSAQTRTGIGLLGKPPAVKQFPPSKATRRTRLLRDPAQTQVWSKQLWLNTTFILQGSRSWDNLAVET